MNKKIKDKLIKAVNFLAKKTKTDVFYIIKSGTPMLISQSLVVVIIFIASLFFANFLSQENFGTYKYILSIYGVLMALTLAGMKTAVTTATSKGYEGVYKKSIKLQLKWNSLAALIGLIISAYYYTQESLIIAVSLIIISICLPFINSFNTYSSFLIGKRKFKKFSKIYLLSTFINYTSIVLAIIFTEKIILIIGANFLSLLLLNLFFYYRNRKTNNQTQDERSLRYGKNVSFIGFLNTIAQQIDKIMLFNLLGASTLALYYFALIIPDNIKNLLKIFSNIAIPKFAQRNIQEIRKNINNKARIMIIGSTLIVALYIIIAKPLFSLFFPQYLESVIYSQVYALYLIGESCIILNISVLNSQYFTKRMYVYNILAPTIKIAGIFLGYLIAGVFGVIWSLAISSAVNAIISFCLIKLDFKKKKESKLEYI